MIVCKYEKDGKFKTVEVQELCFVREGFWIDSSGNFSDGIDCECVGPELYIMPHMIKEMKKKGTVNNGILRGGKDNE